MERRLELGRVVVLRQLSPCALASLSFRCLLFYGDFLYQSNHTFGNLVHGHPCEFDEAERIAEVLFGTSGVHRMLVNELKKTLENKAQSQRAVSVSKRSVHGIPRF